MPYNFTPEDYRKFTEDILKADGDQATLTTVMADMQETFVKGMASIEEAQKTAASKEEENNRLLEANRKLFMERVGGDLTTPEAASKPEEQKPLTTAEYMQNYFKQLKEN